MAIALSNSSKQQDLTSAPYMDVSCMRCRIVYNTLSNWVLCCASINTSANRSKKSVRDMKRKDDCLICSAGLKVNLRLRQGGRNFGRFLRFKFDRRSMLLPVSRQRRDEITPSSP